MNNDIKEITFPGQILDYVDTKEHLLELFNYITNLKEQNKLTPKERKYLIKLEKECEIDSKYKSRIDKAIEYLHHFDSDEICENITGISKILLNILEGDDDND